MSFFKFLKWLTADAILAKSQEKADINVFYEKNVWFVLKGRKAETDNFCSIELEKTLHIGPMQKIFQTKKIIKTLLIKKYLFIFYRYF